jgi:DNA-binding protein YbaB
MDDERTIDELIEIAEEMPERLGLAAGMAEVRGTARGEHVSVAVDVQGMLVELDIDEHALALGPERLAAEISRLSAEAGTNALRDGFKVIKAGCTPVLAEAVGQYLGVDLEETGPPDGAGDPAEESVVDSRREPVRRRQAPPDDEAEGFVLTRV